MADQYYRLESEHGPLDALLLLKDTGQVDAGGHPIVKIAVDNSVSAGETPGASYDAGPFWTSKHGVNNLPYSNNSGTSAQSVTDAPTTGQKIVVTDIFLSVDTACNVTFQEQTSGTVITGPYYCPANSVIQLTPRSKAWKLPTANRTLQVIASVATKIMVDAHYYSEA